MTAEGPFDASTALPGVASFPHRPDAAALAAIPDRPAVLLFETEEGAPVQLLTTQHLRRAVQARLAQRDDAPRSHANLGAVVRRVRWREVACPFEGRWRYYQLARAIYPGRYRSLIAFGPAWFLALDRSRNAPEIRVSERAYAFGDAAIGPWPTARQAATALEGLWEIFDLCRYPEQVRRAPRGERCAYAEMGRCDAPCDGSAELSAYAARCHAAWAFVNGGAADWANAADGRMRAAAATQRFEVAARLKQQIAFARRWPDAEGAPCVPVASLDALLLFRATRRKVWKAFLFRGGEIEEGPLAPARRAAGDIAAWAVARLGAACVGASEGADALRKSPDAETDPTATPDPADGGAERSAAGESPNSSARSGAKKRPARADVRNEQAWLVCQLFWRRGEDVRRLPLDASLDEGSWRERVGDVTAQPAAASPPAAEG